MALSLPFFALGTGVSVDKVLSLLIDSWRVLRQIIKRGHIHRREPYDKIQQDANPYPAKTWSFCGEITCLQQFCDLGSISVGENSTGRQQVRIDSKTSRQSCLIILDMAVIGSLVFCDTCGSLLDRSTSAKERELICDVCGASCEGM